MKKRLLLALSVLAVLTAGTGAEALYKVKKTAEAAKPVFQNAAEEKLYRLRQGEIFTDGGYLKKGVWGTMEGVVQAPPDIVWRLFIYANDWKKYGLPDLIDCRAVNEAVLEQVKDTKKVEDFYKALGNQVIDPVEHRLSRSQWENDTFQFFNMPWPVSDKWFVIRNSADETRSAEGIYKTTWEKKAGNIRDLHGELDLEPFEGNKNATYLRYHVETDPGSAIPRFLIKWGVKRSFPAAMVVIRRESVKLKERPAPLLKIQ